MVGDTIAGACTHEIGGKMVDKPIKVSATISNIIGLIRVDLLRVIDRMSANCT